MEGWPRFSLRQVTSKIGSGATPRGGEAAYKLEGIPLIRSLNVHDGEFRSRKLAYIDDEQALQLNNAIIERGDVLLNITGASIARCCVAPHTYLPARVNQHVAILRPKRDRLVSEFLCYVLTSPACKTELLATGEQGATRQALTKGQLQDYVVAVPPLAEQERIVAILDEAFAGIATATAHAERNVRNARELFQTVLQSTFEQKGEGWVETTIGKGTGGVFTGPFGSLLHKKDYVENGIPLVNPAHITDTGIIPDTRKTVTSATAKRLSGYVMRKGDIVIGRRGEMGRCAVVTGREDGWLCGTGSFFIKPAESIVPGFLMNYLRSEGARQKLDQIAGGAVMKNLSNTALSNLKISLPTPKIQEEIVDKLDTLATYTQRLESIYRHKLVALGQLRLTILQRAFSGGI